MTTQNSGLVRDNSTLANFKSWGSTLSAFMATAGWLQSGDTGQVNWTSIASVPGANAYVYEIWEPNDSLTNLYLKIEYGTGTGSTNTNPRIRVSIGTATNGAGTLSGTVIGPFVNPVNDVAVTSTSTQFQCYFSGAAGRIAIMMWRDDTTNVGPIFFSVERSLNSSGAYTSTHVTMCCLSNYSFAGKTIQQSIVFGVGATNQVALANAFVTWIILKNFQLTSDLFNGNFPISPVFPSVGYFDNPLTMTAVACSGDVTEGSTYAPAGANMPYGSSHTYLAAKNPPFNVAGGVNSALLMRYD